MNTEMREVTLDEMDAVSGGTMGSAAKAALENHIKSLEGEILNGGRFDSFLYGALTPPSQWGK